MVDHLYIVFTDLKGFSKLIEDQVILFQEKAVPPLAEKIQSFRLMAKSWNTWGDAIFASFSDGNEAVRFMLVYRTFFSDFNFAAVGLPKLLPRIAGHFGLVQVVDDPILANVNLFGSNINTAARIEPVTRAGEIFVTIEFKEAFEKILTTKTEQVKFNELGTIRLAKKFGEREVYRLCRFSENDQIIDRVAGQDLLSYLPDIGPMTTDERKQCEYYRFSPDIPTLVKSVEIIDLGTANLAFLFEVSKILKTHGAYEKSLWFLDQLRDSFLVVDDIRVYPFRHRVEFLKLRANVLTRLGSYEEAADIVYGLWQAGHHDSDTLSMLAAQYKRRSIYVFGQPVSRETINFDLLNRALNLYLEAFRIDIDDYYPALNAAYLYRMIGGREDGKGTKLALYVIEAWGKLEITDWWHAVAIAEAQLLLGDIPVAEGLFRTAVSERHPDRFMLESTREQIEIYASIRNCKEDLKSILAMLT